MNQELTFRNKVIRAFGRRKFETVSITLVAAAASVGMVTRDAPASPVPAAEPAPTVAFLAAEVARATGADAAAKSASTMDLPNLDHPRVDSWITKFTTTQRGSYATYLKRMTNYETLISSKLAEREMPQGLIYLAMIESGFNPTAKSRVAATGLWQFMTPTAREYGLRVSSKVDDRKNPERSTEAALEYLSDLYDRFGSWYLAAAAYNTGQGRVARIMKQVTGQTKGTDADYYRISSRLPQETRDYVPKMIAAARIGAEPERYGFTAD